MTDRSVPLPPQDLSGDRHRGQAPGASPDTSRPSRVGRELSLASDNLYLQGIRKAERSGLIAYAGDDRRRGIADDYSHVGQGVGAPLSLKYTNTRPLSSLARQLLNLYRNQPNVRFLELGPGAGAACAAVSRLLPDAEIDTVSLTPLNPYLRFRCDDMYGHIAGPRSDEKPLSFFYERCPRPIVRNQYIGRFPHEIIPRGRDYHLIYEDHGVLFYNVDPNRDEITGLARASISSALSLLRSDGTMVIMATDGSCRMEALLKGMISDADVVVTCKRTSAYHSFPCIVAKQDSPLAARLRESRMGWLPKSEKVLRVEASALDGVISDVCAT